MRLYRGLRRVPACRAPLGANRAVRLYGASILQLARRAVRHRAGVGWLIYVSHERGFALCSMRSRARQPLLRAVPALGQADARRAFLEGLAAPAARGGTAAADRQAIESIAAQLRRRAAALRTALPRWGRRPASCRHRRQGLNLAASDVLPRGALISTILKNQTGLDGYSGALAGVESRASPGG